MLFFFSLCSLYRPHSWSEELCSTSPRVKYLHKLFRILHGIFAYYLSYIYSFNHLFVSVQNHGYLLYTCIIIQYYFILPFKLFQLWPSRTVLFDSCVPLTYTIIVVLFDYFLIFWHCTVLQIHLVYFLPHSQNQPFSSNDSWFFLLENSIRNQERNLPSPSTIHLFNYSLPIYIILASELITQTWTGNSFIVLCAVLLPLGF